MNIRHSKIVWSIVVIAFLLSIFMISAITSGNHFSMDNSITEMLTAIFKSNTFSFFQIVSEFGDKLGIGIVALVFLGWLWWRNRDYAGIAALVICVAVGNEFNKIIKEAVARPRPDFNDFVDAESMSFPSGHAMVGLTLYLFIAYFIAKECKSAGAKWSVLIISLLFILLIGISRVVLGYHYPTDVIGGYLIGIIWLFLWITLYEVFKDRLNKTSN